MLQKLYKTIFLIIRKLTPNVEVRIGNESCRFPCNTFMEYFRWTTLYEKEKATIKWLESTFNDSSRLLDVGANIGIYSIFAGILGGRKDSQVFSIEPGMPNFSSLLKNIASANLQNTIIPINIAASNIKRLSWFFYNTLEAGASGSQINKPVNEYGKRFYPVAKEWKCVFPIYELIQDQDLCSRPFTHVKIDVDGHELSVLYGLLSLLSSVSKPKFVQIEVNPGMIQTIDELMLSSGYVCSHRSVTEETIRREGDDKSVKDVPHNALYKPMPE